MYDILFEGARIVDGQGGQPYQANVATLGSTIALIGREHVRARTCVDASRMVLCPGFIDMHAHSELYALRDPSMPMKSGPAMPFPARYSHIACDIAAMWSSLKLRFSDVPRWPDVPKATRWSFSPASGCSV